MTPRRRLDVAVFGEAIWDLFPQKPGLALRTRRIDVRHGGGAPANVARTLARLGTTTSLITAVGDDELGRALVDELSESGIRTEHVRQLPARTGVTFVDVRASGERAFLFYRHPSADMLVTEDMVSARAVDAQWLHLGSSTMARSPVREATQRALQLADAGNTRISFDVNARKHLWADGPRIDDTLAPLLARADLVKVSEEDLEALGMPKTIASGRALHEKRRERITILTLAERGAIAWWGDEEISVKAPQAQVIDVTGAGDAFIAGVLATFAFHSLDVARDAVLTRALQIGCALGTRAVTGLGSTSALRKLSADATRLRAPLAAPKKAR